MLDFGEGFVDYFLIDSASLQCLRQFAGGMLVELGRRFFKCSFSIKCAQQLPVERNPFQYVVFAITY